MQDISLIKRKVLQNVWKAVAESELAEDGNKCLERCSFVSALSDEESRMESGSESSKLDKGDRSKRVNIIH